MTIFRSSLSLVVAMFVAWTSRPLVGSPMRLVQQEEMRQCLEVLHIPVCSGINLPFYQLLLDIEALQKRAEFCGMDRVPDLIALKQFLVRTLGRRFNDPISIVEAGPGHGRVLNRLSQFFRVGEVYAIEQTPRYVEYLKGQWQNNSKVKIIEANLTSYRGAIEADLVLALWAMFAEFNITEQKRLLKKFRRWTENRGGVVAIDFPIEVTIPSKMFYDWKNVPTGKQMQFSNESGRVYSYFVPEHEIFLQVAKEVGFTPDFVNYHVIGNTFRKLYILH